MRINIKKKNRYDNMKSKNEQNSVMAQDAINNKFSLVRAIVGESSY